MKHFCLFAVRVSLILTILESLTASRPSNSIIIEFTSQEQTHVGLIQKPAVSSAFHLPARDSDTHQIL